MERPETQVPTEAVFPDDGTAMVDGLPVETWLDVCLSDIHGAVEACLPELEGSRQAARERLEGLLGYPPPPELLNILKLVAEAPEQSALRMGLGRVLIALAILVQRELHVLTELRRLDPHTLRRQANTLPALADRVQALEEDIRSMRPADGPAERNRLQRLRVSMIPPLIRLRGFTILVARLQHLTDAILEGRLDPSAGLSEAEVAWFQAAVGRGDPGTFDETLMPRALLDAVALRVGLSRDLGDHYRGDASASRLSLDAAAYELVTERLAAAEEEARAAEQESLARRLSTARRELVRLDRKLAAILRGGTSEGKVEARRSLRRSFLVRSRTMAWVTAAGILAAVAVALLLLTRGSAPPSPVEQVDEVGDRSPSPEARKAAANAEFTRVDRDGSSMVAEITAWAWSRMTPEQRRERIYSLGVMAFGQGSREVWIVDEEQSELAKWSQGHSIRILSTAD